MGLRFVVWRLLGALEGGSGWLGDFSNYEGWRDGGAGVADLLGAPCPETRGAARPPHVFFPLAPRLLLPTFAPHPLPAFIIFSVAFIYTVVPVPPPNLALALPLPPSMHLDTLPPSPRPSLSLSTRPRRPRTRRRDSPPPHPRPPEPALPHPPLTPPLPPPVLPAAPSTPADCPGRGAGQEHDLRPEDLEEVVAATDGYSGADMKALCTEAAMGPGPAPPRPAPQPPRSAVHPPSCPWQQPAQVPAQTPGVGASP